MVPQSSTEWLEIVVAASVVAMQVRWLSLGDVSNDPIG